ncbi:TetR/AcrR family transcriptional regulator [Gracilibacillus sp. S3-1-1]|uniref:TetR/AcrR family transcriptional regulator n=1 Tax=Gracilibacillus pellucidus TaxID=3095368 RepID=A0ACC6M690_9BACI|nr:TetR/AcrR family transcriptional regulator [Gracilibacillus sp. S3-1-1]MDX8046491.1 TetR/AcrR family transcriptional regulator [Gracilibacillus sp. S3-1-1]
MKKEEIKHVAVKHFNAYGYEGVKMAHIAEELGIRKQSLSYHYPSKKELLMDAFSSAVEEENQFIRTFFNEITEKTAKESLYQFLKETQLRFYSKPNAVFLQEMSYKAPVDLIDITIAKYHTYMHVLKQEISNVLERAEIKYNLSDCVTGFITLLDGLITQLVYENMKAYEHALNISFDIFWRGITN